MSEEAKKEFSYGGQAVIEGVMMRGSKAVSVAVRNPEGGIVVHSEPLNAKIYGNSIMRKPFLRGLTMLWDALGLGIKALMFSADVALEEDVEVDPETGERPDPTAAFSEPVQVLTIVASLSMSIGLFFVLPVFLSSLVERWLGVTDSSVAGNAIEGVIRLTLLVAYVWAIGLMEDIRRLYGYHGAEHKTIHAYEAGVELTPANVQKFPLEHPRCGTAFLLTVVVISILIYSLFPKLSLLARIASRLLLLPIIAGISYEILKFNAKHQDNWFIRIITKPNLALQRLTTRQPDDTMVEVAIAAFNNMMTLEKSELAVVEETAVISS